MGTPTMRSDKPQFEEELTPTKKKNQTTAKENQRIAVASFLVRAYNENGKDYFTGTDDEYKAGQSSTREREESIVNKISPELTPAKGPGLFCQPHLTKFDLPTA